MRSITFISFKLLGVNFYDTIPANIRLIIFVSVFTFYFILFKTYTGIIRYSSLKDATRIFKAIAFSFITIVLIDEVNYLITGNHIYVLLANFFYSIVVFISLISFRITVKTLFKYFSGVEQISTPEDLAIIGVNSTTIALAEAFLEDNSSYNLRFY